MRDPAAAGAGGYAWQPSEAIKAAADKIATNLVAFDVSEQLAISDAFLIVSASNDRQVKAIVDDPCGVMKPQRKRTARRAQLDIAQQPGHALFGFGQKCAIR